MLADRHNVERERLQMQHYILDRADHVKTSIEKQIGLDISLIRQFADDISDDELLSPSEFYRMVNSVKSRHTHIKDISYRDVSNPDRIAFSVQLSMDQEKIVVDIPIPPLPWEEKSNWNKFVVTMDSERFFETAGVLEHYANDVSASIQRDRDIELAIYLNKPGEQILLFGDSTLVDRNPVYLEFMHAGLGLKLAAIPKGGWEKAAGDLTGTRLILGALTLSMLIPMLLATFLLRERSRNIRALKRREQRLLDLSDRFDLAMQTANIGIWEAVEKDERLYLDSRAARLHGLPVLDDDAVDRFPEWLASVHAEDRDALERQLFDSFISGQQQQFNVKYRVLLPDGTMRYMHSVATPVFENGYTELTGVVLDVTTETLMNQSLSIEKENSDIKNAELELALDELSQREHELSELSHRLDLALASYNCGTWEGDMVKREAIWDERMHQLYGLPFSDKKVSEHQWISCLHPDDRREVLLATKRSATSGQTLNTVQRVVLPNNELRYVRSVGQVHMGRDGKKKIMGIAFDITADALLAEQLRNAKAEADMRNIELELAKNRIEYNALHDPLTSLANRRKLDMELDELSREGSRQRQRFAILHLDLDRFKEINDTLGHAAGDAMLVHASKILMRHVPRGDLVARIGGDEFVVLAKRTTTMDDLAALAQRIIEEMSKPIDFEGFDCRCGVSIGIAQSIGAVPDARKVLVNADIALYQAKEKGRNCFEFFTQDLQANIIAKKRMADEILSGLDRDEFTVFYQPQFDAETMRLTGAEALVRWRHPDLGIVPTNRFLKVAEELNVMARIDQLVLQTALKDQMRWIARGIDVPRISVNVSSKRLHDDQLIDQLAGLAIAEGRICFELVESIFLDESDEVVTRNIERIKSLGIDIEIDDFGTGHTSIVSLLKLKPKRLKIDRQLVMPILTSPQERSVVRSIVEIARSLGIETVAEGVETQDHGGVLRQLGCDYLQGYAFARPLSFEDFSRFVSDLPRRKAS
ncbi:EAL domain-containing protein [Peteryoungia desertarenae]|uniref:EAL domain-containing protein n=2 Tax=Peteryoungia desertarenae TaxID=1813451 RepID=A0ABX6QS56_9HYPH|nr:EAL domain-containing protein [Peteryoungia desertarenae]